MNKYNGFLRFKHYRFSSRDFSDYRFSSGGFSSWIFSLSLNSLLLQTLSGIYSSLKLCSKSVILPKKKSLEFDLPDIVYSIKKSYESERLAAPKFAVFELNHSILIRSDSVGCNNSFLPISPSVHRGDLNAHCNFN